MKLDTTEMQHVLDASGAGRVDLYTTIHKALRAWMGSVLVKVGQMDADDNADCQEVMQQVSELLDVLQGHLETENAFVHPAIEARHPGALAQIEADHVSHSKAIAQLRRHVDAVLAVAGKERASVALFLYRELALFVAENMEHMQVEETQNHQLLWAAYSNAELEAIHGAILASLPPQKMAAILPWMIPAIPPADRAMMLQEMRANAPAAVFDGVLDMAKAGLSTHHWSKLCVALKLPQVPGLVAFNQG